MPCSAYFSCLFELPNYSLMKRHLIVSPPLSLRLGLLLFLLSILAAGPAHAQSAFMEAPEQPAKETDKPLETQAMPLLPQYYLYAGNTHAHTIFTISHGAQHDRKLGYESYMYVDSQDVSHSKNTELKPDWREHQDLPSEHFSRAKTEGFDFYITTDHSQEAGYHPTSPASGAWVTTKQQASEATDSSFVAIAGYEHSENDGPGGRGHLNVINTSTYLNALEPEVDLPHLYKWLGTVQPGGEGPVVATFNHPDPDGYDDWANPDSAAIDVITMLEVINSNDIHYEGFVNALDKGWKVSPVCGNDNHGLGGIGDNASRTYVLATKKTKAAILNAMKNRRTYASLEQNLQAKYAVNKIVMGSTLESPGTFQFDIEVQDPDTDKPEDRIEKIDIVKDNGVVAETYAPPTPSHSVRWSPTIRDSTSTYFFVRVWNAGGGDASEADSTKPVAWLAPVWTGR